MSIESKIKESIKTAIFDLYDYIYSESQIIINPTRKEFEGSYTFTSFPLTKELKKPPEEISKTLGKYLVENTEIISSFQVVGGFLNLSIKDDIWIQKLNDIFSIGYEIYSYKNKKTVVEFPGPNTNKPLHLGHLRNMFLGASVSNILEATGHKVYRVNIVNNRGIHICKSMIAYQKYGNEETPKSAELKGDHFVGKYYVKFEKEYKKEVEKLISEGVDSKEAEKQVPLMKEVKKMLIKWENQDHETRTLWNKMNNWVYEGFDKTYKDLDITFIKTYYESDTYLLGKNTVEEGLQKGCFYKKNDQSVWVDLEKEGLDNKLILRSDGTSVYMTQDMGTADERYKDFKFDKSIYVVGNEQDYHFKVLFKIMKKLDRSFADQMFHLSYGMVDLPSGKMKSREGTVVDADNIISEMYKTSIKHSQELGKIESLNEKEAENLYKTISLGALRYFLLKVDSKKRMLFDPEASIDFHGDTGPFIQYTHARICSLLKKANQLGIEHSNIDKNPELEKIEIDIISHLYNYPKYVKEASDNLSPSLIAQYSFELAKLYNKLYADLSIINEKDKSKRICRLIISKVVSKTIKESLKLLAIEAPQKM